MSEPIKALLFPKSVAVIGASADSNKLNGRPLHFMRRDGFRGRLYPVNPRYEEIDGMKCYPDIASLPETPDLAIVVVSAARCLEMIDALGKKGTQVAVIFSSGFGEIGPDGRALEEELLTVARSHGIRICGPNNLGLINSFDSMTATFSQYADIKPKPGPVAFASQSGAFGTGIAALARSRGLGIGYFVNTGNQIDITLMDVLKMALNDERITVAAAYLEGVRDADALIQLAEHAQKLQKPLVAVKVGRKAAGARAAASHTGSLAGEDAVFDGIAYQHGILRARNEEHMLDLVAAFANCDIPNGNGIAIVTQSGGAGALMADRAEELGCSVPLPSDITRKKLSGVIPNFGALGNPVDVTGQFLAEPRILKDSVRFVLEDPAVNVGIVWLQLMHGHGNMLVELFREIKAETEKPFIVCWLEAPEQALSALAEIGVCVIPATERAVDAAAGLIQYGEIINRLGSVQREYGVPMGRVSLNSVTHVPAIDAYERLKAAGIPLVDCGLATDANDISRVAETIGFPIALKIESPDIQHKFDVGGVILGLECASDAESAAVVMRENIAATLPDARINGFLIQSMSPVTTELIMGFRRDPIFGSVVMVGLGGVFIEVMKDVVFARAPLTLGDALAMLDRLHGREMLMGVRGMAPVDRHVVAETLIALGQFALDNSDVIEVDLNPVFADTDGVIAVDWLMLAEKK
ncbi:MAG: hypothetical protein CBB68_09435 [Rhodospirillaceae bacterium TMED8]|nr:CoA-binding protein [Magnetovibrio sp.]OUT50084.1 MAG: hypothetical protein CBB68_09435 [Rhodospirillaceae bacterium TMED8]|tara:strand:- start:232 stop:2319 length:2088 start_codon:yes stop_codon:yes gene_type:complete